jgi:hypothetical protein
MRKRPFEIPDEPPSDPPYLNSTASWYSGDAWFLFQEIVQRCGLPSARFIFEKCIAVADEQESRAAAIAKTKAARRSRPPIPLPTAEQIAKADRRQICIWWARLRGTDQKFNAREKRLIAELRARYLDVGGYPAGFNENHQLPPIPKKRNKNDAVLVKMFDRRNPQSAYCIERKKRGGKLTVGDFAATLVPTYGASADHILRKVKYQRSGS